MISPYNLNSTPVPPDFAEKSAFKSKWISTGIFGGGALVGVLVGLALGPWGFLEWAGGWTLSDLNMEIAAQPLATILAASGVVAAAMIAFHNGEATRKHEGKMQEEIAKRDTERSLRDRFFKITETLSDNTNYVKREAGVYALVALADDWAVFHHGDSAATKREQQTCLNVIAGQLRDPLKIASHSTDLSDSPAESKQRKEKELQNDPAPLIFKRRVQNIIWERFKPSDEEKTGVWSHLDLDLSNCHLFEMIPERIILQGNVSFNSAQFHGYTSLDAMHFQGNVSFNRAQFQGLTSFKGTQFHGYTSFISVKSHDTILFNGAHFQGDASFNRTHFHGLASFKGTHFHRVTSFEETHFHGTASFKGTHFHRVTSFEGTHFHGTASFEETQFHGIASFEETQFHGIASFEGTHFHGTASFEGTQFHGIASFEGTHFCSAFIWREVTGHKLPLIFKDVRFRTKNPAALKRNADDAPEELVKNATFSASCPFHSPEEDK